MRISRHLVALVALLTVAVLAIGCVSNGGPDPSTTTSAPGGSSTSTTGGTGGEAAVRVYFAWNEKVGTAGRTVPTPAVARGAVSSLLDGPDAFETDIGMGSEIPADTELLGIGITDGTARVDLSSAFESGGGSLSMQLRVAQVVFTVTQFDTVDAVDILLDGEPVEAIGGEGVPATDLTRADFEAVTPFILVEAPVPGEEVTSPLEVSGISNTFEANVRYTITDPEGLILEEGFTTATGGNGVWGDFSFTESFTSERPGLGAVIVFQDDADSGGQRDVYEVPVRMG